MKLRTEIWHRQMHKAFAAVSIFLVYGLLSIAVFLMLRIVLGYLTFADDAQFLAVKQEYIHQPIWKLSFYVHVFTSILALSAGYTQFSPDLRHDHPRWHRFFGRLYVLVILFINVPSGMVLAVNANGLLPGRIAFVVLDILWFWFTFSAYRFARTRQFARHREFMIRSYALTLSAITLRSWNMLLSNLFNLDPSTLYAIDAWLGFLPNLLTAEWWIRRRQC